MEDLISLWSQIQEKKPVSISLSGEELEFKFELGGLDNIISYLREKLLLSNNGEKFFTIKKRHEATKTYFFKDLKSLFSTLKLRSTLTNEFDFFVFDYNDHYLFFNHTTKEIFTNSRFRFAQYILDHYISYSRLLNIFKTNVPTLVEIDKPISNELIIVSKGVEKFVTTIRYEEVDDTIFQRIFTRIPIEEFELKFINDEWIASFKSGLCQFMENQNEIHRTFGTLYLNFSYITKQADKDYQLFVSKFSFEKIRKQFKTEKNSYFESLSVAQDKITSQIVSIPISLGASIFSFYQLSTNFNTILLVYGAILIYSFFIVSIVLSYIFDVNKLGREVKNEEENIVNHFPTIIEDFKEDFNYMRSKRKYVRFIGWAIIIALITTLALISYYVIDFNPPNDTSPMRFI